MSLTKSSVFFDRSFVGDTWPAREFQPHGDSLAEAASSLWQDSSSCSSSRLTSDGSYESDEGQSYHEGDEECEIDVQGCPRHGVGGCCRIEEGWTLKGVGRTGWDWQQGGEEERQVYASRPLHDQDPQEEGNERRQEDDVRQGSEGQAAACKDCGEGFSSGSFEAANLKRQSTTGGTLGTRANAPDFGDWALSFVHSVSIKIGVLVSMRLFTLSLQVASVDGWTLNIPRHHGIRKKMERALRQHVRPVLSSLLRSDRGSFLCTVYNSWLVVWNMAFIFPYIGNVIIPTDELHHFSEG